MIRELLDTSPIGLAIVSTETLERVFVNQAMVRMFGASSEEELRSQPIKESWVNEAHYEEASDMMSAGNNLVDYKAERYRLDGSRWWVLMNSHFTEFDGARARVVWHVDITKMVEAQEAAEAANSELESRVEARTRQLQDTEARFRDYANIASDWFWEMDKDLKYTLISDAYEKISGKDPKTILGKSPKELYTGQFPEETDAWTSFLDDLEAHRDIDDFTHSYRRADGTIRIISRSARAMHNEEGVFLGYRGVGFDVTERQWLQTELARNQAQLMAFSENSTLATSVIDRGYRYVFANKKLCENFDLPEEEVIGKTLDELYLPEQAATLCSQIETVFQSGEPHQSELFVKHRDGRELFFLADRFPIRDGNGEITSVGNINTDITERKQIEQKLRDSEARYQMIVDMQSELLTRFSPDWKLTFVNRAYCEFVNNTEDNLIGSDMFADAPENLKDRLITYFEAFTPETAIQQNQNQLRRHDGELRDFEWSNFARFDENGKITGFQSVGRDITERNRAEQNLKESEARYQAVVDGQSELITRFTPDGKFTFVNGAYCRFIGRPEEEVLQATIFQDLPESAIPALKDYLKTFSPETPIQVIENGLLRHDGEIRQIEWQDTAYFDEQGNITEFQSVARDVTEQRKAQKELVEANEKAQEANRAKSNFLSTMSHEIRTPLNGVLGLAQLLTDSDLDADQRKKVETILSSGQTLLAIINDVLDMSKIEAGGMELEETAFSLRDLVSVIATPFQSLADDKGIQLRVANKPTKDSILKGDPVRLRQILWNLLSNAIKFTDKGEVTLTIQEIDATDEPIPDIKDQLIVFSVKDSGVGIAQDRLDAIFDAFTQEDSSITRKFGGTGLGLSIVKQLTDRMGGTVRAKSTLGEGAEFTVTIPFAQASLAEAGNLSLQTMPGQAAVTGPLKVLVAEDNSVNAMIAKSFLEKFGHEVRQAENGKIAVEIASDEWADLILMDIHMPEMDGIEATRIIRTSRNSDDLPIIGLTAEAFAERHAHFRKAGMNDILTKPFTERQLSDILNAYGKSATAPPPSADGRESEESSRIPVMGDIAKLDELRSQLPPEVMETLFIQAEETLNTRMKELQVAVSKSDSQKIREVAHSIKGASGSLFATQISAMAARAETNHEDIDAVRNQLPEIEKTARETLEWWRYHRDA